MKNRIRLTEAIVEALEIDGRDRLVLDSLLTGFGVRVTPSGTKLFVVRARAAGKPTRVTLGRHPSMKVSDARREARAALDDLRAGKTPQVEKAAREAAKAAGGLTVEDLANRWMREVVEPKRKPLTARDYRWLIDNRIAPRFGAKLVSALERGDVVTWHADMKATPRRANYAVAVLKAMMSFAEDIGARPSGSNPCRRVELYAERQVERFMSEAEIGRAADAIAACEAEGVIGPHAAAGLRLALLTGARAGEITAIEWTHVNLTRRWIRLPDSKTGAKTIYLSPAAVEVLKGVPKVGPFVVAGADPSKPYARLGHAWMRVRAKAELDDVRLHDLRHTFASVAAAKGFSLPMIGRLLGHKVPATTQRYAHLAVDVAADANDQIGLALDAAMAARPQNSEVISLAKARRSGKKTAAGRI